ncbi:peptidoglycan endopeptidase [Sphingomonas parva]|uniref:Peptidoglycan endopeptidase n=1 Tax=Sphingomonas parva TaxID=2555898 RepID=A0A4Y8ZMH9_9SPHN|nr:NlpC/P60 family protein [Sphingomonas parva]TFI57154.1 peptidoglycan endopeptidase [Sphingomonas parva]
MSASNAISSSRTAPAAEPPRNGVSSSSTERFSLDGPSIVLDPRIHAWRKDIADVGLAGRLFAPHYARPLIRDCGLLPTPLRAEPQDDAAAVSELLPGEKFAVLDITSGWAWGYSLLDHRVGYIEAIELADPLEPTHVVVEAGAPIQTCGDPLSPPLATLPMGSRLHGEPHGAMLHIEAGCVPLAYLQRVDRHEDDPVIVAQRLLGAPYRPGGRTIHGIDCAGLVQLSLQLCGIDCPRDVDHQRRLGEPLPDDAPLHRGDLLFCEDHVGMMVDDMMAIQVSLESRRVSVEPFRCARPEGSEARIERRRLTL